MTQWVVTGLDRSSGISRRERIHAWTEEAAINRAADRGIVVDKCQRVETPLSTEISWLATATAALFAFAGLMCLFAFMSAVNRHASGWEPITTLIGCFGCWIVAALVLIAGRLRLLVLIAEASMRHQKQGET